MANRRTTSVLTDIDCYSLAHIVRDARSHAETCGRNAAHQAEKRAEEKILSELGNLFGGKVLYAYDESHENRFVTQPLREWNAISTSFPAHITKTYTHLVRRYGIEHADKVQAILLLVYDQRGELPTADQRLVFQVGGYWYCFFTINGDEFCEKVEHYIASQRKEQAARRHHTDPYDDL